METVYIMGKLTSLANFMVLVGIKVRNMILFTKANGIMIKGVDTEEEYGVMENIIWECLRIIGKMEKELFFFLMAAVKKHFGITIKLFIEINL